MPSSAWHIKPWVDYEYAHVGPLRVTLGRGGFGVVYRSVDGTKAIKTLDCRDADSPLLIRANGQIALKPDVLKVCHTEVALVWSFSHPNICRVYGGLGS